MSRVEELVTSLRQRSDLDVEWREDAWLLRKRRAEFVCGITIPMSVHEWFASVSRADDGREAWSDWMDHHDATGAELDAERAESISAFIHRVLRAGITPPLSIHAKA